MAENGGSDAMRGETLRDLLGRAPVPARRAMLTKFLVERLREALGDDSDAVSATAGFEAMGVDSRMAVELKEVLEEKLAIPLGTTLLFDQPNVRQLTDHLIERLDREAAATR